MNQLQLLLWNEFNVNNHSPKTNLMSLDMPELVPLDKHTKSEIPKSKISEIKNIMNDFASYYGIQDIDGHLPIYQKDMEALGQTQIQQIGSNNYKVKISLNPEIFKSYSKMMGIDNITIYHEFTHALTTPLLPYMTGISNNEKNTIMEMLATYGLAKYLADKKYTSFATNVMNNNPYKEAGQLGYLLDKYYVSKDHSNDEKSDDKYFGLKGFLYDMQKYGAKYALDRFYDILKENKSYIKNKRDEIKYKSPILNFLIN